MNSRSGLLSGLSVLSFLAGTLCVITSEAESAEPAAGDMVYELRIYTTLEGRLDALHARFRDHTCGLFAKHGMTNLLYSTPLEGPEKGQQLVYLLAHKSKEARDASFAAFRDDPAWKKARAESEADGKIVSKVESTLLVPTDYTPASLGAGKSDGQPRLFELRTYTTNAGKLPNLNARFRDHTMRIFEKHGMQNVLYTTPLDGDAKDVTLIYLIAHKDSDAAQASWKAFVNDPEWKKVARESQVDGQILVKGGVKRMYLVPTDYSAWK